MAIFRARSVSGTAGNGVFEAFCTARTDLTDAQVLLNWQAGSIVFCIADSSIHVKQPDGSWTEVA